MNKFKKELKRLREEKGLTQAQLARELGVSRSTIGNYEQGIREPDFESLEAIADYFNVSMSILLDDQTDIEVYLRRRNEHLYDYLQRFLKLDAHDKARIEERIDMLLESDKYKETSS